jgi:hypothetical protein
MYNKVIGLTLFDEHTISSAQRCLDETLCELTSRLAKQHRQLQLKHGAGERGERESVESVKNSFFEVLSHLCEGWRFCHISLYNS